MKKCSLYMRFRAIIHVVIIEFQGKRDDYIFIVNNLYLKIICAAVRRRNGNF